MKTVHSAYSFLLLVLVYELPLFDHVDHFGTKKIIIRSPQIFLTCLLKISFCLNYLNIFMIT